MFLNFEKSKSLQKLIAMYVRSRRSRHPQLDVGEHRSMICRTKLEDVNMPRVYSAHGSASNDTTDDSIYYRTYESRRVVPPPPPPAGRTYCSSTIHPDTATALQCAALSSSSQTSAAVQFRHHVPATSSPQPCDIVRGAS